jgi:DNA-binding CsgD family transcriptional regulator
MTPKDLGNVIMITNRGTAEDRRTGAPEDFDHRSAQSLQTNAAREASRRPQRSHAMAQAFAEIRPDGVNASVIVDPDHLGFRYANLAGRTLLERRYPARLIRGTVEIVSARGATLFGQAMRSFRQSLQPTMVVSDGEHGAFSVRISLWAPSGPARGDAAVAILDFRVGAFELATSDLRAIGEGFGLTEAETAVLGYLVEGQTLAQIAVHRGVQLETIRRQCKFVLAKMGCHRQVDLVRLMISLCAGTGSVREG